VSTVQQRLLDALSQIDRPGSFCAGGSAPAVLPGLEVEGFGAVGMPLTSTQAEELKKHCEQAPYGKGEETVVDTKVRRVWRLKPDRFALTNPDWQPFLQGVVESVQEELGLEEQELESHLYDLLLYEPGSFFLPHRDGEKLGRMVATLVLVLPGSYQGGELVVRHDGEERVFHFGAGEGGQFRIHYAAFYADCEHEVRPLREGYRLCLVYNLTLAKAKKKPITAPRASEHVEAVSRVLAEWAKGDAPEKLAVTLDHQYTQEGLTWDALKGLDRARARVLVEAAGRAGCRAHLALLTYHEAGEGDYADGGGYYGGGYYNEEEEEDDEDEEEDEDGGEYEMIEVYDTSLTAEHWIDPEGRRLNIGAMDVEEEEVLDPDALKSVTPEEEFQGYTGNEGQPLDRWYRHGAIFLWPDRRHFEVLCTVGSRNVVPALELMVDQWKKSPRKEAEARKAECVQLATAILAKWQPQPYYDVWGQPTAEPANLLPPLGQLGDAGLIRTYLRDVLAKDASVDPGESLVSVCQEHGWEAFRPELEVVFRATAAQTVERNARLLEHLYLAKPRKKQGWLELCAALAREYVSALEGIDQKPAPRDYGLGAEPVKRVPVLAALARALIATAEQLDLLGRVVDHALAHPKGYPLKAALVPALVSLQPWLKKNVKEPCPPLSRWLAACREQLEALTAEVPHPPADFRRDAALSCKCAECRQLSQFLADPGEREHRFSVREERRRHLEDTIRRDRCDVDCRTEARGRPYTLVCTKNTASYQAALKEYHQDQERLAAVRAIEAGVPE
jgi:hypothetical protein